MSPAARTRVTPDAHPNAIEPQHGACAVRGFRLPSAATASMEECWVVSEDALTLDVEGIGSYTLMWTATEDASQATGYAAPEGLLNDSATAVEGRVDIPEVLALAAGFAYTEGIIASLADIRSMAVCADRPDIVRMQLVDVERAQVSRRNVVITSSCGICGGRDALESALTDMPQVTRALRLSSEDIHRFMRKMRERQTVFTRTGGAHAAALFAQDGRLLAIAEDLGRHNALDKVIGYCLLAQQDLRGCVAVLSSRLSYELVAKSARAGLEIVAAVSAPSSLAIEVAQRCGITLCGFVRGEGATVYSHPERIRELAERSADRQAEPSIDTAVRLGRNLLCCFAAPTATLSSATPA